MTDPVAHIQLSGYRIGALQGEKPLFIPGPRESEAGDIMFTTCGGNGLRVPPVPIPNTEVKPQHADGTWLETARESRSLPDPKKTDL